MRANVVEASEQNGNVSRLPLEKAISWPGRLASFAALCEEKAAEADEEAALHLDVAAALHRLGILASPLPRRLGGGGLTERTEWAALFDALRTIGAADLSIGRLFEGHANAVDLVHRYGTEGQFDAFAAAIRGGAMTGVWGADGKNPLKVSKVAGGWHLRGGKILASGAGMITRPLVTAGSDEGQRLILLGLEPRERCDLSAWTPLGMRSSATGSVDLSGIIVPDAAMIGDPGDFARQPHFSAGAWRFCAVHLGATERLVDLYREQLRLRRRGEDPYQLQRLATCISATATAAFWIGAAARQLAQASREAEKAVALSNFTRGIMERSALEVIETVQRGVGLSSFIRPNPIERVARDLSTYLRQPVPDLAMADAARFALASASLTKEMWNLDEDQFLSKEN